MLEALISALGPIRPIRSACLSRDFRDCLQAIPGPPNAIRPSLREDACAEPFHPGFRAAGSRVACSPVSQKPYHKKLYYLWDVFLDPVVLVGRWRCDRRLGWRGFGPRGLLRRGIRMHHPQHRPFGETQRPGVLMRRAFDRRTSLAGCLDPHQSSCAGRDARTVDPYCAFSCITNTM